MDSVIIRPVISDNLRLFLFVDKLKSPSNKNSTNKRKRNSGEGPHQDKQPFFCWFSTLLCQSRWRRRRSGPIFQRSYGRQSETASTTASTFSDFAASARHGAPQSPLFSNPLRLLCLSASLPLPPPRMTELCRLNPKLYSFKSKSIGWNRSSAKNPIRQNRWWWSLRSRVPGTCDCCIQSVISHSGFPLHLTL